MRDIIAHLNYAHVFVVTVAGFVLGWIWYAFLFGKTWMAEMKVTDEMIKATKKSEKASSFIRGLVFTFLSTLGLAALIASHGSPNWKHGAAFGAFVGLFGPAMRMLNNGAWERRSLKLQFINAGHEVALYALQGAILAIWH